MKARRQKLERIRFREWDARARDALRSMLERAGARVPDGGPNMRAAEGAAPLDVESTLADVERCVSQAPPLVSPLSHFVVDLEGDRLQLLLRVAEHEGEAVVGEPDALPRWVERQLFPR